MENIVLSAKRIESIDIIRGIALCGILFINIPYFFHPGNGVTEDISSYTTVNRLLAHSYRLLIAGKFVTIFSFLFGTSIYLFLSSAEAKGLSWIPCYLRRSALLYAFSCLHGYLWNTDIIGSYVIAGLFIFPLYKCSVQMIRRLLLVVFCIVVFGELLLLSQFGIPFLSMISGFCYHLVPFITGFYLAKIRFFYRIPVLSGLRKLMLLLLIVSVVIIGLYVGFVRNAMDSQSLSVYLKYTTYPLAASYILGLVLLLQIPSVLKKLRPFSILGKMSLTNYLTQDQWGALLLHYCFALPEILPVHVPLIMVVIVCIQLVTSRLWLLFFRQGPAEWLLSFSTVRGKR